MPQAKPIKRSKELAPLSREHHDGLLLSWKIRTGLNKQIDTERIAAYVLQFYKINLEYHFQKEENYLFILLNPEDLLRIEAENQHKAIEKYIDKLKEGQIDLKILTEFADLLEQHIRFEERTLFPHIEQQTSIQVLQDAGAKIASSNKQCELEWDDQFWLKTN